MANFAPRAIRRDPPSHRDKRSTLLDLPARDIILLANSTQIISAELKLILTIVPRIRNCDHKGKAAAGSTNWGKKAIKKMATFGLSISTIADSKKALALVFFGNAW